MICSYPTHNKQPSLSVKGFCLILSVKALFPDIVHIFNVFLSYRKFSISVGQLATYTDSPSFSELDKLFPWVQDGGRGKPTHCFPRHRVAIIIPYRNRDKQLRTFLYNIHPILQRQELDYGIYVVEQVKLCTLLNKGGIHHLFFLYSRIRDRPINI